MINILKNKELLWTVLYQFTLLLGGILLIKLLALTLSKSEYGHYALITSIMAFVLMLPFTAIFQAISRYLSIYQKKRKFKKFLIYILILVSVLLCLYTIVLINLNYFGLISKEWEEYLLILFLLIISETFKVLFKTINNAKRMRKNLATSTFIEIFIKIFLIYSFWHFNFVSLQYVLIILFISNIFSILLMSFNDIRSLEVTLINKKDFFILLKRIILFSSPLIIWSIFGWFRDMSNRWYLDHFLDMEQVALFAMLSSIAMIAPTALQGFIGGFFIPILYQKDNQDKRYVRKFLFKIIPTVLLIFIFSFFITYIFKNEIILIVAADKYLEISWMLPWMFLAFSFYSLSMISTYEIFAHKQVKKLIWSSVLPGIISVVCGYFFIKNYGINGALYNYIITYSSYAIFTFIVVYKHSKSDSILRESS